jgi:hypothetical protein
VKKIRGCGFGYVLSKLTRFTAGLSINAYDSTRYLQSLATVESDAAAR